MSILPEVAQLEFKPEAAAAEATDLRKSFLYDFTKGDFILKDGKLVSVEDIKAIQMWVEKVLRTERFKFAIYKRDDRNEYGVTLEDLIGTVLPRPFVEAEIKREVSEAVTRHPRIQSVSNLSTEQDGSRLIVSFKINLIAGQTIGQEVTIGG